MSLFKSRRPFLRKKPLNNTIVQKEHPVGSMYFNEPAWCVFDDIPETHVQYEFSDNWEEDNEEVAVLGLEMIRQICAGYVVLTEISSDKKSNSKEPVKATMRFTYRYHSFLINTHPEVSVYAENEQKLFVLSKGFNKELHFSYTDINTFDLCSFKNYLFLEGSAPRSAEYAWEAVKSGRYDMCLFLANGPIALEIILNPNTVAVNAVQSVVEDVCKKNHTLLFTPEDNTV